MTSLATPIFKVALRKSSLFYIRGSIASLLCGYLSYHLSKSIPLAALTAAVIASIFVLMLWGFTWSQMFQAVRQAEDLENIAAFYASEGAKFGTSARFWVAESREHGGIVGCLALKRAPKTKEREDEAELRFLSVHHDSTGWEGSIELLLQTAVKYARASGFKAIYGKTVTCQDFLELCYLQQGFKEVDELKSTLWFTLKTLKLSIKK